MNKINNRIITFGCSYTYGTGLPDCPDGSRIPSSLGWPSILSSMMGKELVNISVPGASNFEILYNILKFNFQDTDTVIILWTHYYRDTFFSKLFSKKWPINRLGPWSTKKNIVRCLIDTNVIIDNKWIENMNDKTFAIKSWVYINHADLYLKSKNIRYLHYPVNYKELDKYNPGIVVDHISQEGFKPIDQCIGDLHPGPKSQQLLADKLYKILENEQ